MQEIIDRRKFMKLAGIGGAVFVSSLGLLPHLGKLARAASGSTHGSMYDADDFYFVQLSDSHWGFKNPKINPRYDTSLPNAIAAVNGLEVQPDFVVFTGDLTQTTDDGSERRRRMEQFSKIARGLAVKDVKFLPGEHDASLDEGTAFREFFGPTYYTFKHKGVNFIVLDNVSDPQAAVGDSQRKWLSGELARLGRNDPIIVLTHRPLFDLLPSWDWATADGAQVVEILSPYQNVTVFYGHIHQINHHMTGHIAHHSARSLMWPLPAPGSLPKKIQLPWDPKQPYKGLGFREVRADPDQSRYDLNEFPLTEARK
jgi:3',5'-cyclic AMP phosphodiesterase CpdA